MKLLSFDLAGAPRFGAVSGDRVIDLTGKVGDIATLRGILEAGALARVADFAAGARADIALSDVKFRIPVAAPDKILCVGVNYGNRNAEYKDGSELPKYPSIFPRFARSFVGHGQSLVRPPESPQLDYEGEIAIVIGKGGRRIPESEAESHIAGLTCLNEGTIRDWTQARQVQRHAGQELRRQRRDRALDGHGGRVRRLRQPARADTRERGDAAGRQHLQPDVPVPAPDPLHLDVDDARARRRDFHRDARSAPAFVSIHRGFWRPATSSKWRCPESARSPTPCAMRWSEETHDRR